MRCGVIIAALSVAVSCLKVLFEPGHIVFSLAELAAIVFCLYKFGGRQAMLSDSVHGYSFGQNMGFILAVMLFSGFVYGVCEFLQPHFIVSTMADKVAGDATANDPEAAITALARLLFGILRQVLYGGIVGLFVTPFVTRRPEPQNTQHDEQQA